ncbi:MAG: Succinate-acetate transporter protein [Candidatus Methanohalarchaeum thermophilum]|uniref:Succinate-acetate transporter protein n=1 Tax=Methanohalarchaeum thermophilum TaxID=1903181 RepID=A0A1Q6DTW9_METT1|nr:MAG: Succinate-acetate transporter protein [Candidatus Methanohalarchaeum thermophilum]
MGDSNIGNPVIIALSSFATALLVLGIVEATGMHKFAPALLFAVFWAGVAQIPTALISAIRGDVYVGSVVGTFGNWLLAFFLLQFVSATGAVPVDPAAVGLFSLILVPAILILWIPAIKAGDTPFNAAFAVLTVMILFLSSGEILGNPMFIKIAGVLALIAAAIIYYVMYENTMHLCT